MKSYLILLFKEIKDFLKSKTTYIFIILLAIILSYSFYSAVDLYSKASLTAVKDKLYAQGFEPASGIFVPTLGGLFILLSLFAPFVFIQSLINEKHNNTLLLLAQMPFSTKGIFYIKSLSSFIILIGFILLTLPIFIYWHLIGGHIPYSEALLLLSEYMLYGLFIIAVSFFSASIFKTHAQASIFSLFLIILSWFIDFGKDMNIPFVSGITKFSITHNLKYFENGTFSLSSTLYLLLIISFLLYTAYVFFNFSIREKTIRLILAIILFISLMFINQNIHFNADLTESRKASFSFEKERFLKKIPAFTIDIYLDPGDSRAKDFENDFLKKLSLVKTNVKTHYIKGKELQDNYGTIVFTLNNKKERTFSTSEEEIFIILQKLSGLSIKKEKTQQIFPGYPLVVKNGWAMYLFIIYSILSVLSITIYYMISFKPFKKRR